jgi:hypothetical protein
MTADDVWRERLAEAKERHERDIEAQWVHINKLHARPWTTNTSDGSPDPLEDNHVEQNINGLPLDRIDSHDPIHFATHEGDFKIQPSHSESPMPDEHRPYDAGEIMLEGFVAKASPALPMISTFPSYKGNAAVSHVPMEVDEADGVPADTIKREFED